MFCSTACSGKYKSETMKGKYFCVKDLKKKCTIPTEVYKLAYLAGIIDGEGTIMLKRAAHNFEGVTPAISVANTDFKLLDWLLTEVHGSKHSLHDPNKYESRLSMKGVTFKLGFTWKIGTLLDCRDLLNVLLPYLIIKYDKALIVLDYCNRAIVNHELKLQQFRNGQLEMTLNMKHK
jgi:hypothetical protein